jgi:DNA-binding FadR family transcriptional regulator
MPRTTDDLETGGRRMRDAGERHLTQPAQLVRLFGTTFRSGECTLRTVMEVRAALEPVTAALAARHRSPRQLAALVRCTNDLQNHLHDSATFRIQDHLFHDLVAEASRNPLLATIVPALSSMSRTVGRAQDPRVRKRVAAQKRKLVHAIEEGDSWTAAQRMDRVIAACEEMGSDDPHQLDAPTSWGDVDELIGRHPGSSTGYPSPPDSADGRFG